VEVVVVGARGSRGDVLLDLHSCVCLVAFSLMHTFKRHISELAVSGCSPRPPQSQAANLNVSVTLSGLHQPSVPSKTTASPKAVKSRPQTPQCPKTIHNPLVDRAGSDTCSPKLPQANPSISVRFHLSSTLSSSGTSTTLHGLLGDLGGSGSTLSLCG
jgi:hypothetical protein